MNTLKDIKEPIDTAIEERRTNGQVLATKFPELKGLSFEDFVMKLPIELDFVTANEMYEALNTKQ